MYTKFGCFLNKGNFQYFQTISDANKNYKKSPNIFLLNFYELSDFVFYVLWLCFKKQGRWRKKMKCKRDDDERLTGIMRMRERMTGDWQESWGWGRVWRETDRDHEDEEEDDERLTEIMMMRERMTRDWQGSWGWGRGWQETDTDHEDEGEDDERLTGIMMMRERTKRDWQGSWWWGSQCRRRKPPVLTGTTAGWTWRKKVRKKQCAKRSGLGLLA